MAKAVVALALVCALGAVAAAAAREQEIFLPPDCDVLKIVGNGFRLELSQFESIREDFKRVEEESGRVEAPRQPAKAANGAANEAEASYDERPVVDEELFERARASARGVDYGQADEELLRWISDRATALLNRVQRYNEEHASAQAGGNRIVLDILLLNTLVDLDNLNKEEVAALRWVRNKLQKLLDKNVQRETKLGEVRTFVASLIDRNRQIEAAVQGRNEPGREWVTNTQAMKRVLHEQRFSAALSKLIVEFLAGRFALMKRSVVYELNRQPGQLDDGLYYANARGRVPADFPFSAQDAISHGAYN